MRVEDGKPEPDAGAARHFCIKAHIYRIDAAHKEQLLYGTDARLLQQKKDFFLFRPHTNQDVAARENMCVLSRVVTTNSPFVRKRVVQVTF